MTIPANSVTVDGSGSIGGDQLNTFQQVCTTVAVLRDFVGLDNMQVYLGGYTSYGDGGQGVFYYDTSATAADDGGVTTVKPSGAGTTGRWIRVGSIANAVGSIIQCTATGTNDIILSPLSGQPTISGYAAGQLFGFITPNTSNAAVTIQYQSLSSLATYTLSLSSAGAGAFVAGTYWIVAYNANLDAFQQVASLPTSGSVAASSVSFDPNTVDQAAATNNAQTAIEQAFYTPSSENVLAPHKNLIVKYVSATTVDIDADTVVIFNAAGYARKFTSINLTVDITASGANGLDTGAEGSSTWYHLWVIAQQNGTVAGLLSASATAPTLPADYLFYGYVGAVYNNSSSNFVAFYQRGDGLTSDVTAGAALSGGTQTSYTTVSLAAYVPITAKCVDIFIGVNASSGTAEVTNYVAPAGSGTTATYGVFFSRQSSGVSTSTDISTYANFPLSTAQQVVYRVGGTNARGSITVMGWRY